MNYFIFTLKSKIKLMPILCAILLIFMGSFYIISNSAKNSKINLEICFLEQNPKNNMLISLINGTTSTKNNLFLTTSYDLTISKDKLTKGVIDVLITVPKNFYESILNSENKSAKISFSPLISELEKGIFTALAKSSMNILSYAQANIYVSDSITDGFETFRNAELNKHFLNKSLSREDNFKIENSQKDDRVIAIYISLLILSIVFVNTKSKNFVHLYAHLKVKGNSILKLILIEIFIDTIIFLIASIIPFIILKFSLDLEFILKLLIISLFVSSLTEFTAVFFKEGSSFFILIISIISILSSGLLIPRLAIFTILRLSPVNLIISNTIFSFIMLTLYSIILVIITVLNINKLLE